MVNNSSGSENEDFGPVWLGSCSQANEQRETSGRPERRTVSNQPNGKPRQVEGRSAFNRQNQEAVEAISPQATGVSP